MPLKLREKVQPKKIDASVPDKVAEVFDLYIKDSMKESNYPETALQDARDQVALTAIIKLMVNDKKFVEKHKEQTTLLRKYLH